MKRFAIVFVCLQTTFALNAFAGVTGPSEAPKTLLQSIATAVKNNSKTKAIDELLESISYATKAAQMYRLPRGYVSCSLDRSYQSGSYNGLARPDSTSTSGNCSIGASVTIYDGGAGRNRAKSAAASEQAAKALYNTADSFAENTRGGLAARTQQIFSRIARTNSFMKFYSEYLNVLKEFESFKSDDNLTAMISDVGQNMAQFENSNEIAISNFQYVVTVAPHPEIDDFDQAIQSLTIPSDVDEAVEIATTRAPQVLRRNLNVQMAEFNLKAERASYGPLVTLHGGVSGGQYRLNSDINSRSTYTSKSVGITVTIPIDFSAGDRLRSTEKNLSSVRLQRDAALKDAEYEIRSTYKSIANNHRLYVTLKKSLDEQWTYVNGIVEKIRTRNTAGLNIDDMLTSLGILSQRHSQFLELQSQILQEFFNIQQVTGLLFDNIDAQPQINTVF